MDNLKGKHIALGLLLVFGSILSIDGYLGSPLKLTSL
jgi:hypothetical protein